jgi:hypothetical protein
VADAMEDKIEHNESKMTYEKYLIWLRSYALKAGGWVPRAVVVIPLTGCEFQIPQNARRLINV